MTVGFLLAVVLTAASAVPAPCSPGGDSAVPAAGGGDVAGRELELVPFDDKAFVAARKSGAPVGLYFEAEWCAPCKEMHSRTFRAPAVVDAAAGIRLFRVDITEPDRQISLLQKSFQVIGAPTVILFGPDGKESDRRFGFIPPDDLAKMLVESRKAAGNT